MRSVVGLGLRPRANSRTPVAMILRLSEQIPSMVASTSTDGSSLAGKCIATRNCGMPSREGHQPGELRRLNANDERRDRGATSVGEISRARLIAVSCCTPRSAANAVEVDARGGRCRDAHLLGRVIVPADAPLRS
jgi:hypothetical protein